MTHTIDTTPDVAVPRTETAENQPGPRPTNNSNKGSLLSTLTEIVSEHMSGTDMTAQGQPGTLTQEQNS